MCFDIEDWELLQNKLSLALKDRNKDKTIEVVRRVYSNFPNEINEKIAEELKPLVDLLKSASARFESSELNVKVSKVVEKWEMKTSQIAVKDVELIAKRYDFANEGKKEINTVDAKRTVPGKSSKSFK
jgi:hypothetical protein